MLKKIFSIFIIVLLFCAFFLKSTALYAKNYDVKQSAAHLKIINNQIKQLQQDLQNLKTTKDHLEAQLKSLEVKSDQLNQENDVLKKKADQTEKQISSLSLQLQQLQSTRKTTINFLVRALNVLYAKSLSGSTQLIFNLKDPQESLDLLMKYMGYLYNGVDKKIRDVNELTNELLVSKKSLLKLTENFKRQKQELEQKQKKLLKNKEQQQQLTLKIKKEYKAKGGELVLLEKVQSRLEAILAQSPTVYYGGGEFVKTKGNLSWPIQGRLVGLYGQKQSIGPILRQGILIKPNKDQYLVRAVFNGRVIFANWLKGYGLMMIIDHGDGYMTLYSNNNLLLKNVGNYVLAHEPIARIEDTNQPIYFEIRFKGKPVNPSDWLKPQN